MREQYKMILKPQKSYYDHIKLIEKRKSRRKKKWIIGDTLTIRINSKLKEELEQAKEIINPKSKTDLLKFLIEFGLLNLKDYKVETALKLKENLLK